MQQLVFEFYREALYNLDRIQRSKLSLSDRIALEKALVQLDAMKKILNISTIIVK